MSLYQADKVYAGGKKQLEEIGCKITDRRINSLSYWNKSQMVNHRVGGQAPNGETIAVIFDSDIGYFVGTYATFDELAEPLSIRYALLIMHSTVKCLNNNK